MPLRQVAALVVLSLTASGLHAQGFGVYEHGTCQMGRGGTGVAASCSDGSAIFFNPAGLAGMHGFVLSSGITLIATSGSFTDDLTGQATDLDNPVIPIPHFYAAYGISERLAAGLGLFVPYGLVTQWPMTFEGRFSGYDNKLRSIYIQPTLAYKITDRIAVGAGFDFVIGSIELNQRLDVSSQPAPGPAPPGTTIGQLGIPFHTEFADAQLKASKEIGFGGNVGVWFKPIDRFSIGAKYLTQVSIDYEGTATFDPVSTGIMLPGGNPFGVPDGTPLDAIIAVLNLFSDGEPLADQGVSTTIRMPDQLIVGMAVNVTPSLMLLADWQWVNWSTFDSVVAEFEQDVTPDLILIENYGDTHGFRLGVDWAASERWTLRGGYLYHQAAAPAETVTPLLPEASRNEITLGVGLNLSEVFAIDLAYQYINQNDRRGRVRDAAPGTVPTEALNSGLYNFTGHLFGTTLAWRF